MKTLYEKFVDYCIACGFPPESDYGFKLTARPHFFAGAAAMAEIFAENPIRVVMTGNPGSATGGGAGGPAQFGSGG